MYTIFLDTFIADTMAVEAPRKVLRLRVYNVSRHVRVNIGFLLAPFKALCRMSTRRIIDNVEACHLAEWEQEQPLCLFLLAPLSQPDQILGSNPAVPITIAALVIAVVDSTIIVEDPFPRRDRKNWQFVSLKVSKIKVLPLPL